MKKILYSTVILMMAVTMGVNAEEPPPVKCNAQAYTADPPTTLIWQNQYGSQAKITVDEDGLLTGTYINGAPSNCTVAGAKYYLTGFCYNNAITFSVSWPYACNSLTSWSGVYNETTKQINTLWYTVPGGPASSNSTVTGTDVFTQLKD